MKLLTPKIIRSIIKPREAASHKGNYGHALLIAGNKGKMGSAVIAAKACLRTGNGLLTVNVPQHERMILQTAIPEAMLQMRETNDNNLEKYSAIGIGPGIGTTPYSVKILSGVIKTYPKPIVLDADALTIISNHKTLFKTITEGTIITPHPKEFDRLFGMHKDDNARRETAIKKAKEYAIVIVLKGHHTCISFNGETFMNTTGNAGLAKGGSGDALTGIITSFLAQGYNSFNAAKLGVYMHGLATDITLKKQSMESMLITDVIENLGKAFKFVLK